MTPAQDFYSERFARGSLGISISRMDSLDDILLAERMIHEKLGKKISFTEATIPEFVERKLEKHDEIHIAYDYFHDDKLGYVIEKERQNRGYATEVCRAIVEYAGSVLMMQGLNCFVRQENVPSIRLCRRLGFEYLEDAEINGILMNRYHIDLR